MPIFLPYPPDKGDWSHGLRVNLVFETGEQPYFEIRKQDGHNPWLEKTRIYRGKVGEFASVDGSRDNYHIEIEDLNYQRHVKYVKPTSDSHLTHYAIVGLFGATDKLRLVVGTGFYVDGINITYKIGGQKYYYTSVSYGTHFPILYSRLLTGNSDWVIAALVNDPDPLNHAAKALSDIANEIRTGLRVPHSHAPWIPVPTITLNTENEHHGAILFVDPSERPVPTNNLIVSS